MQIIVNSSNPLSREHSYRKKHETIPKKNYDYIDEGKKGYRAVKIEPTLQHFIKKWDTISTCSTHKRQVIIHNTSLLYK